MNSKSKSLVLPQYSGRHGRGRLIASPAGAAASGTPFFFIFDWRGSEVNELVFLWAKRRLLCTKSRPTVSILQPDTSEVEQILSPCTPDKGWLGWVVRCGEKPSAGCGIPRRMRLGGRMAPGCSLRLSLLTKLFLCVSQCSFCCFV